MTTETPETTDPTSLGADWVPSIFASDVFSIETMRRRMPRETFDKLLCSMERGEVLDPSVASVVASAMKDWAIERGATHYCHWFQPMTGLTAEKHDSFISPTPEGDVRMEFSGKELTRGEPDASSFPSGGLREGFEARGYTVWDCTSPVFVKRDGTNATLFIPSVFCSYTGFALDHKTPLLRSNEALNRQALRVLRALGDSQTQRVNSMLGVEQEYFLVDEKLAEQRLDLNMTGRTLFGAETPKGMAMSVHYFGSIQERVASFMNDVNVELWKLGVSANTQHNEISPCQFEIAPVYAPANVATDHNHLTMEALEKVAERHGLRCLLHEKPFAGFGGSGKHHNWSMVTDRGQNLLDPGKTPHENEVFLIFLCGLIKAIDTYADVLRSTVASPGNDHRLGAMEAPPAIMSMFLGDQLHDILECLEDGKAIDVETNQPIKLGVSTLPAFPKDSTDRNRTSPFAFTGNRFEFRTAGSALSPAKPTFALNTMVADALSDIADVLEKADDVNQAAQDLLPQILKQHSRVLFSGDNYTDEWLAEATRRGLPNLKDTVESLDSIRRDEVLELFDSHRVLRRDECLSRIDIDYERYAQDLIIEARCAVRMAQSQILPRAMTWSGQLAETIGRLEAIDHEAKAHREALDEIYDLITAIRKTVAELETIIEEVPAIEDVRERAVAARDRVLGKLTELRTPADRLETLVDTELWPFPTYAQMLCLG